MTLHDTAARAGGHRWLELAAWRLLGGWAPAVAADDPELAVALDTHAQHAAWRAAQWWDRLPVLAVVDRDALVVAPPGMAALVGHLDGDTAPATALARAAAAYRVVLPRLVAAYEREAPLLSPVSEGPALRTLAQVRADAAADWAAGEALVQARLTSPAATGEVSAAVAAAERAGVAVPG